MQFSGFVIFSLSTWRAVAGAGIYTDTFPHVGFAPCSPGYHVLFYISLPLSVRPIHFDKINSGTGARCIKRRRLPYSQLTMAVTSSLNFPHTHIVPLCRSDAPAKWTTFRWKEILETKHITGKCSLHCLFGIKPFFWLIRTSKCRRTETGKGTTIFGVSSPLMFPDLTNLITNKQNWVH